MDKIAQAAEIWRAGRGAEAEQICLAVLAAGEASARPLLLLGEICLAGGRTEDALGHYKRLCDLQPQSASHMRRLAGAHLLAGQFQAAIPLLVHSLRVEPGSARAHHQLGQALAQSGAADEALTHFSQAIALEPRHAPVHVSQGMALAQLGRLTDSVASYRRATAIDARLWQAHFNCGNVLRRQQQLYGALECYDRAIELCADALPVLMARSEVLLLLQRIAAGLADCERVLAIRPAEVAAWVNRAHALLELNRSAEALESCMRAIALDAKVPDAHHNHARALRALHRDLEALEACDRALQLNPDHVESWCSKAQILQERGEDEPARCCYRRALELDGNCVRARVRLMLAQLPALPETPQHALQGRDQLAAELGVLIQWAAQPYLPAASLPGLIQPLFFIAYQEHCNRELLTRYRTECSRWMSRWCQEAAPELHRPSHSRAPAARTRVAIVSAHVFDHSVYRALTRGWLHGLERADLDLHVFYVAARHDDATLAAAARVDRFEEGARPLHDWVKVIQDSQPDILLFPEVGMDILTLQLAAMRLAPTQLAAWGHPETTGLPTIDGYLSAAAFEPPDATAHYSECLITLPGIGCHYEPYGTAAAATDLEALGLGGRGPLIICPGVPIKYAPQHDRVLVDIARNSGQCQFVFFDTWERRISELLKRRLETAFRISGLDPQRYLTFVPWQSRAGFFGLLCAADLCLDTIGFSGFNTVMQALECGVPCIGYEGRYMRGRLGSGILRSMGLSELVATDISEFVDLTTTLATNRRRRIELRDRIPAAFASLLADRNCLAPLARLLPKLRGGTDLATAVAALV